MVQNNIRELLINHPIIPVVKIDSIDEVIPCVSDLISKDIHCIEITLRTECAIDAIKKAKKHFGDKFSIGVGTEKGGPIPIKSNGIVESYKKDQNGEVVISKRSDIILTSISESTDGVYIDGNDTNYVIDKVKDELQKIEKKEFEAKKFVSYKDRFQIFLILGFIFLFIDQIVLETKTKWVARLNLFNEN